MVTLNLSWTEAIVFDPLAKNVDFSKSVFSNILSPSMNDDYIFMQAGDKLEFIDFLEDVPTK